MSVSNLFEANLNTLYAQNVTSFVDVRTNRVDVTDPQPLLIADEVATELRLGNNINPIDVYINGQLYTGSGPASTSGTMSIVFKGPWIVANNPTITITWYKLGNIVTLYFPTYNIPGTNPANGSPATIQTNTNIDVGLRTPITASFFCPVFYSSTRQAGRCSVGNTGSITISNYTDPNGQFPVGGTFHGWDNFSITYRTS